jgi:hypothetical protein
MKRILLAFLLVSVMAGGCKKNNEKESEPSLHGRWLAQEKLETAFEGGIEVERKSDDTFTEKDYIVFNSDGTAISSYEGAGLQHSTYSVAGKTLTLAAASNPNELTKFEIKVLTKTSLVIFRESVEVIQNVNYTDVIQISFKRM